MRKLLQFNIVLALCMLFSILLTSCNNNATSVSNYFSIDDIPAYDNSPYITVNNNQPYFDDNELTAISFEEYSSLDSLGRCAEALCSVSIDIMPTDDRESISSIYPTGWMQNEYDNVDGGYLYNRCHLLGFQLTGENSNEKNLITGTRQMNVEAMLPFENMVADYVRETNNHVYMRVTPIFEGDNLLATGVLMEAKSVEDNGEGILFNIFCYNAQDGISIDYKTGDNSEGSSTLISSNSSSNTFESIDDIDTNGNGIVTISEAKAAGYDMPITSEHWLYKYMVDSDGDGIVGE